MYHTPYQSRLSGVVNRLYIVRLQIFNNQSKCAQKIKHTKTNAVVSFMIRLASFVNLLNPLCFCLSLQRAVIFDKNIEKIRCLEVFSG